jgi:hypothetical protein
LGIRLFLYSSFEFWWSTEYWSCRTSFVRQGGLLESSGQLHQALWQMIKGDSCRPGSVCHSLSLMWNSTRCLCSPSSRSLSVEGSPLGLSQCCDHAVLKKTILLTAHNRWQKQHKYSKRVFGPLKSCVLPLLCLRSWNHAV